ncbi:hypothetical protein [Saccharothrix deserti]|uniref:hypothetical protein n=1 Tax=Saccharothrix deserti TaxID=2593674 RepID=UPI00131B63BE|nr:hypothetical protein [Saccharothrix deserti]
MIVVLILIGAGAVLAAALCRHHVRREVLRRRQITRVPAAGEPPRYPRLRPVTQAAGSVGTVTKAMEGTW